MEIENTFGENVKEIHSDGGKEYVNKGVKSFLENKGIRHTVTVAYTPQQNGVAERENRILIEAARSMIYSKSQLPLNLWAEAINTAAYIINRTGPSKQSGKTPFDIWFGKTSNIDNLKVFGTECFVHIPDQKRRKLDKKSVKGFLVGYIENGKGFRVYVPSVKDVILSRDVVFKTETLGPTNVDVKINKSIEKFVDSDEESFKSVPDSEESEKPEEPLPSSKVTESDRKLRDRRTVRQTDFYGCPISFIAETVPSSYVEAINSKNKKEWEIAMKEEIESLNENKTWELVDKPVNQQVIKNRWVFSTKINLDGTMRFKARLVVKGYAQKEGIDYKETFSPVVRFDTIRTLLAITASDRLHLGQFDIKTAFLYGSLKETVFMSQPEGFNDGSNRVCKLKKSLYGLKQAPRCWSDHFDVFIKSFGFKKSSADPCFYVFKEENECIYLAIYVDDGLLAASSESLIDKFFTELNKMFKTTSTKNVNSFLGIEICCQNNGSIFINQRKYVEKIVERFNLCDANVVSTPIDVSWDLNVTESLDSTVPYREAVGNLMYLHVVSRPDIGFAINIAARALENPTKNHWSSVKRIIRYVKGTIDLGLLYCENNNFGAYSDADFAGDKITRKSTTGIVCMYAGAAIVWQSKRQQCVSLSTTEAEYVSAASAAKEVIWLKKLFNDCEKEITYTLYVDNMSAIKLLKNPEFHQRSKHIDVKYHFIRNLYENGELVIEYVPTNKQLADVFTKPLAKPRFLELRMLLGLISYSHI